MARRSNQSTGPLTARVATALTLSVIFAAAMGPLAPPAFATSVSQTSISTTTPAAGATGVTYKVGFTTSAAGALVFPDTITLTGPPGSFTGASFNVIDTTADRNLGAGILSNDGTTAVLRIGTSTPTAGGNRIEVTVTGATNAGPGTHTISVSTSKDTTPVPTPSYTLGAPQALSQTSIATSTPAAGATGVTYDIGFTTSSSGQLVFPGTITLTGPAGTFTGASFNAIDTTANRNLGVGIVSNDGTTAVLRIGTSTPTAAGNRIVVTVTGATNAGGAGGHSIQIDTSSDTPATTPSYNLVAPQALSQTSISTSTPAAGATGVTYNIGFKTSPTGQLAFPGTITLTGPAGTFTGASFNVIDTTAGRNLGVGIVSNDGATVVLRIGTTTPTIGGNTIAVTVTGATNSSPGSHSIAIDTSSDTPVNTPAYNLAAAQPVTQASVIPSTGTPGSTGVTYTVGFTTSSSGQLVFPGTITLSAPEGTLTNASFNVIDTTANRNLGAGIVSNNGTTAVLRIGTSTPTAGGNRIVVTVTGATNAGAGAHTFAIRTSSDTPTVPSAPYTLGGSITPPPPPPPPPAPDTTPPDTTIASGPSGATADPTPTFTFTSSEPGSTFQCSIDNGPFRPCSSPFTTPPLAPGTHTFRVRAIDAAGNADPSPAGTFGISAGERTFTVGALPSPVLAKKVNVEPVKGEVFVSVPAGTGARASASVPGLKGRRFVPLSQARQIPVGSLLDTRKGTVRLTTARNSAGATQSSDFLLGVFQVVQSRRPRDRGLTELRLKGSSFRACGRASGKGSSVRSAARRGSRRRIRRLRGNGSGRFRTRGRYSAATVRGTDWTVSDRCDGTLTQVKRGRVAVRDFRRRKNVTVRAGKSYLAKPRR